MCLSPGCGLARLGLGDAARVTRRWGQVSVKQWSKDVQERAATGYVDTQLACHSLGPER